MTEINTSNLIDQMRVMIAQSQSKLPPTGDVEATGSFGGVFQDALKQMTSTTMKADQLSSRYQAGDPNTSLAEVMVETQKANLGFQATLTVRNKIVQAYQDVMNMSV